MNVLLSWLRATRPHTMGLSFAVILVGSLQVGWVALHLDVLLWALLSAAGFQLVSNFANDYGDFIKGTDHHRKERYRALSAGKFTLVQVRVTIIIVAILSIIFVLLLLWSSPISTFGKWLMFALGIASILAALGYTLGKRPYGYYALGDVMVFVFFGWVGVVGSYYLQGGEPASLRIWCVATAFGALATAVLNINNIRDRKKDRQHKKMTVANLLSQSQALVYQQALFIGALFMLLVYGILTKGIGLIVFAAAFWVVRQVNLSLYAARLAEDYHRCLALTVKYIFLLALPTAVVGLIS